MKPHAVDLVVDVLADRAGLGVTGTMRDRLVRCLHQAAEAQGVPVGQYASQVLTSTARLQELIEDVTVQESSFFRDEKQFEALARHVLPGLRPPVRIWSAGCARGQEPYSLAMLLLELGYPDASVIATDISARALSFARDGRYPAAALRGLSPERRDSGLARDGDLWTVREPVRRLVTFTAHNLAVDTPPFPPGHCPVIFCRNVLIYFRRDTLLRALQRIRDWLPPGGVLFLGYSESLWQVTDIFELVRLGDAFLYRKPADAAAQTTTLSEPAPVPPAPADTGPAPETGTLAPSGPSEVTNLLRRGESAMADGDLATAATAFRQAAYLDGGQPLAHFQLGLVLEVQGRGAAATRAFRAARSALRRVDPASVDPETVGYRPEALVRLIDAKLAGERG